MYKKLLILLASASMTLSLSAISSAQGVDNMVYTKKLTYQIGFLSDPFCKGRAAATEGNNQAAFWICDHFRKAGLLPMGTASPAANTAANTATNPAATSAATPAATSETEPRNSYSQHFYLDKGGVGHNIIGMMAGSKKHPRDSYIIVGAHYDGIGTINGTHYPGADSNASGVAAMLNIAEMLNFMRTIGRTYENNVIFVAFDAKEVSMAGSAALWKMIEEGTLLDPLTGQPVTAKKIKMMVNIDQIGGTSSTLRSGRKDYLIMLGNNTMPRADQETAESVNYIYGTRLEMAYDYYGSAKFTDMFYRRVSDQKPFVEHRIPAVMFTSGITMKNNKPTDTVDSLDLDVLTRRVIFIFHWLENMI